MNENIEDKPSHFSDHDQFFLHQIEHNLYPDDKDNASTSATPINFNHPQLELNMDHFDFMLNDAFEKGHPRNQPQHTHSHTHSQVSLAQDSYDYSAYPPTHLPENTPSLLASNQRVKENQTDFVSPILPSQNEHSYNNQHLYHKHNPDKNGPGVPHVRPDAVFTPLVSPAMTPLELQINTNTLAAVQTTFEPLTSPALAAQTSLAAALARRRSSSNMFGADDESQPMKRRTPHSTPVLQPNNHSLNSLNKMKQSPSIKSRTASKSSPFDKLPESGSKNDLTPMLPPQSKKIDINESSTPLGSNTLMGFTMGRLAESQSLSGEETSPNLRASRSRTSSVTSKFVSKSSSSSETSPTIEEQKLSVGRKRSEKPATKKASHKLAEQGRRNRMNIAVQELSGLIPQSFHDRVSIPSKATTVELASEYIRTLQAELDALHNE